MSNRFSGDPPDSPEEDWEPSEDDECQLNGHSFEEYDTISKICAVCGEIREYVSKAEPSREVTAQDGIHICRAPGDHSFGLRGVCNYCGKPEGSLTAAELEQHAATKRARKGE